MDLDSVARAFVEHYYRTFDTNRGGLAGLYQESSMLSFEGAKTQGAAAITAKLTGLPFQQCQHNISTIDCQPSGPVGGVLVFVSGSLQLAGEQYALKFSQPIQWRHPQLFSGKLWCLVLFCPVLDVGFWVNKSCRFSTRMVSVLAHAVFGEVVVLCMYWPSVAG